MQQAVTLLATHDPPTAATDALQDSLVDMLKKLGVAAAAGASPALQAVLQVATVATCCRLEYAFEYEATHRLVRARQPPRSALSHLEQCPEMADQGAQA